MLGGAGSVTKRAVARRWSSRAPSPLSIHYSSSGSPKAAFAHEDLVMPDAKPPAAELGPVEHTLKGAREITEAVYRILHHAVAVSAMYDRCADKEDVLTAVSNSYEGWGFNVIRESLYREIVLSLLKVHDLDQRAASLINVIRPINAAPVRELLREEMRQRVRSWGLITDPVDEDMRARLLAQREEEVEYRTQRIDQTLDWLTVEYGILRRSKLFAGLKTLRDTSIAHSDTTNVVHGVKYGFERELLGRTVHIFHQLGEVMTGVNYNLDTSGKVWGIHAEQYWRRFVLGPKWGEQFKRD